MLLNKNLNTPSENKSSANSTNTIIRLPEVIQLTGLSSSTIYDRQNRKSKRYDPEFPRRFKIGLRSVGYSRLAMERWVSLKMSAVQINH